MKAQVDLALKTYTRKSRVHVCVSTFKRMGRIGNKIKNPNMCSTLHRISRWFDHGHCVILTRSVNRCVKASQARNSPPPFKLTFGAILAWASLFQAAPSVFKTHRKVSQSTTNEERSLDGHWGKKRECVGMCVCVLGRGIQYCRLGVNGLGALDCKVW